MTWSGYARWVTFAVAVLLLLGVTVILLGSSEVEAFEADAPQQAAAAIKGSESRAPTATLPVRYYIPHVAESINYQNSWCSTVIIVTTPFTSPSAGMSFELEVFNDSGVSQILQSWSSTGAGARWTIVTDQDIKPVWTVVDHDLGLDNFTGFATVNASDPRLYVTAYDWCRTGIGALDDLVSMNAITVYPQGATLDFLKAGLPAGPAPPHAGLPEPGQN
jgi:hypothetical protein